MTPEIKYDRQTGFMYAEGIEGQFNSRSAIETAIRNHQLAQAEKPVAQPKGKQNGTPKADC